jgi:hypothetical protein
LTDKVYLLTAKVYALTDKVYLLTANIYALTDKVYLLIANVYALTDKSSLGELKGLEEGQEYQSQLFYFDSA